MRGGRRKTTHLISEKKKKIKRKAFFRAVRCTLIFRRRWIVFMFAERRPPRVVAFLAVGTRGDVQPLAILAARFAARGCSVHFVTNFQSRDLEHRLRASGVRSVVHLSLSPVTPANEEPNVSEDDHRDECVRALKSAFGLSVSNGGRATSDIECLLVVNLFALEGFHIAEALGVPCEIVSPCLVPYSAPTSLLERLERAYPGLYDDEVKHWMYQLFDTNRWGSFRRRKLHLDEVPFLTGRGRRPNLIYAISPTVCPIPGYWPSSVKAFGYFFPPDEWSDGAALDPGDADFFAKGNVVAVCLSTPWDMGLFGETIEDAVGAIQMLCTALKQSALKGLFVLSSTESLLSKGLETMSVASVKQERISTEECESMPLIRTADDCVAGIRGFFPHRKIFPMCAGVLHHGGTNTTAESIRAGKPQIIQPTIFDQNNSAERMTWLGVATTLSKSYRESELQAAFEFIKRRDVQVMANNLRYNIESEGDAVDGALGELEGAFSAQNIEHGACIAPTALVQLPNGWRYACLPDAKAETLFIYEEIVERGVYSRHGFKAFDGCTIVDVGANTGMLLLSAHEALGGENWKEYIAIEPIPHNFAVLEKNAVARGIRKYRAVQCGIGNVERQETFSFFPAIPGNSTMKLGEKLATHRDVLGAQLFESPISLSCQVLSLDSALKASKTDAERIDILKIDVEGSELDVLAGISSELWGKIKRVVVEVHDIDGRLGKVLNLFCMNGFTTIAESQENVPSTSLVYAWTT